MSSIEGSGDLLIESPIAKGVAVAVDGDGIPKLGSDLQGRRGYFTAQIEVKDKDGNVKFQGPVNLIPK
jgi:hypothetical protein